MMKNDLMAEQVVISKIPSGLASSGVQAPVTDEEVARLMVGIDDIAKRLPAAMCRSRVQALRDLSERVSVLSEAILLRMHLNHSIDGVRGDSRLLAAAFQGLLLMSKGARVEQQVVASARLGHAMALRLHSCLVRIEIENPLVSFFPSRPLALAAIGDPGAESA